MAKDPAFLFYPNDYAGGTMGMTLEEKGAYMELLILQFNKGAFTIDQAKKLLNGSFEKLWEVLSEKFTEKEGRFFNERLDKEKTRRKNFIEKQVSNGMRGGKPKHNPTLNPNETHGVTNIENEIEIINEDEIKDKGVQGEKELSALEIGNTIEFIHRLKQVKLSHSEIKNFWEAFMLNGQESAYLSRDKKIRHFRYWIKNELKNGNTVNSHSNKPPKLGTSAARIEALKNWGFNEDGSWRASGGA